MNKFKKKLRKIFNQDERQQVEVDRLTTIMALFAVLPDPPDPEGIFPLYGKLKKDFTDSLLELDPDIIEERFLLLYCHLHGYDAPYTLAERETVNLTGGYWCHAGGLSPITKAGDWIREDTISADFGAGNGLQGLLLQKLYPHKLSVHEGHAGR